MSSYAPARISLDRYRIPHALLIYPTHPFVHVLVLPSPSSPLISLRSSHLNDSAYPARPVSPFNMFLILHLPHSQSALCIHSSQTSDGRTSPTQPSPSTDCFVHLALFLAQLRIAFTRSLPRSLMLVHLYHPRSFVALVLDSSHFARSYYNPIQLLVWSITFFFCEFFLRLVVYLSVVSLSVLLPLTSGWLACKTLTEYPPQS